MIKKLCSIRLLSLWCGLFCLAMLGTAAYMQFGFGLDPCPLCVLQRLVFIALAIVFLIGATYVPRTNWRRVYYFIVMAIAVLGAGIAGRQVWLQHLPADKVPSCGMGLDYMVDHLPWHKTLQLVLRGSGECAKVQWQFLGLSIPEWTFICFSALAVVAIWQMVRGPSK